LVLAYEVQASRVEALMAGAHNLSLARNRTPVAGRPGSRPALALIQREPHIGLRGRTPVRRPSEPDPVNAGVGRHLAQPNQFV
jgi:hypothetical protein